VMRKLSRMEMASVWKLLFMDTSAMKNIFG
jgi:hypothetical protein